GRVVARAHGTRRQQELDGPVLRAVEGQGPVSPWHVYLLEAHLAAADDVDLRRSRPRDLHSTPIAHQHALAGAGTDERPNLRGGIAQAGRTIAQRGEINRGTHHAGIPADNSAAAE